MNRRLFGAVLAVTMAVSSGTLAGERTIRLSVPGMTCASCPFIVEGAISALDGIEAVEATMDERSARVTFDDTLTDIDSIRAAAANVGYQSTLLEDGNS